MKKTGIAILVLIFGELSLTMAQQGYHGHGNPEVRKYFEEQILPVIEAEQQNYYKVLSSEEMKKIEELKRQLNTQIAERRKGMCASGKNKGMPQQGRAASQAFFDEASTIAEAHPKAKGHFLKTMDANKDRWVEDMKAIREETASGAGRMRFAPGSPLVDNFSNAGWLLLWDKERRNFQRMASSGMHGKGMGKSGALNGSGLCDGSGKGQGNGRGRQGSGMGPGNFHKVNPELRAEIHNYVQENIIPVVAKERDAFDRFLNAEEKEQIALAREKRKVRRMMFVEWHNSADFEPGARRNDPRFNKLREDMQNSMAEVRAIAATHSTEIQEAITVIRTHALEWENEIKAIAGSSAVGQKGNFKAFAGRLRNMTSPVRFLMFTPNDAAEAGFFNMDINKLVDVTVFPNPASSQVTVRINGLDNQLTEVSLYNKEGGFIESLYNEQVIGTELAFGFSVADLDNDIYIVKVKVGNSVVARKIIVRK